MPDETIFTMNYGVNNTVTAVKRQYRQYSLVLPLLCHCLPDFDEIYG